MNDDLERAFGDLADAAARAAERGILAAPALEPTLHRLTVSVRRRRAARTVAVGALAVALVAGTAGAVSAGLRDRGTPVPPAETTSEPTPTSAGAPTLSFDEFCGTTQIDIERLAAEAAPSPAVDVTAPAAPVTAADAVLPWSVTVANLGAETLSLLDTSPVLVLIHDAMVSAGGPFDTGTRGPAEVGQSTDFRMTRPVALCGTEADPVAAGDYTGYVLVAARPLGSESDLPVVAVGGPFPLTFTESSATRPLISGEDLFPCGQPLPFDDSTVPQPAGLWLAPDLPVEGWTTDRTPEWGATLTTSDERVVDLTVNGNMQLAFVGSDGLVKGRTWTGDVGVHDETASNGAPLQLPGDTDVSGCLPDGRLGGVAQPAPLEPGTYTVWAYLEVTINRVTPDGGVAYEPDAVVVAVPPATTVTVAGTVDPVDALFPCGEAPTIDAASLPDAGGLELTADVPAEAWPTSGAGPGWSARLSTTDDRTVLANVSAPIRMVFVGADGRVAGSTFSGDTAVDLYMAGPGASPTAPGQVESARCGDAKLPSPDAAMPAGTYTAWPLALAVLKEIQHPDGFSEVPSAEPRVIVGTPLQVTFG